MSKLETLNSYRWPTVDFALASIGIRLADLAARNSLTILQWEEDGLGMAEGVMCRSNNGLVFLLQELQHAVTYLECKGPDVYVDAEVLGTFGAESLLNEVLDVLGLSRKDVTWVQPTSVQEVAAEKARWAREYKTKKTGSKRDAQER